MKTKVVIVTGGWDPLHSGHVAYLASAARLGDFLVAGINSDDWLTRKKGTFFLPFLERYVILSNLRMVDRAIGFNDKDGSAIDCIRQVRAMFPEEELLFANGGDRTSENIPEQIIADELNVTFIFGIGGNTKMNSSSDILNRWKKENI